MATSALLLTLRSLIGSADARRYAAYAEHEDCIHTTNTVFLMATSALPPTLRSLI